MNEVCEIYARRDSNKDDYGIVPTAASSSMNARGYLQQTVVWSLGWAFLLPPLLGILVSIPWNAVIGYMLGGAVVASSALLSLRRVPDGEAHARSGAGAQQTRRRSAGIRVGS